MNRLGIRTRVILLAAACALPLLAALLYQARIAEGAAAARAEAEAHLLARNLGALQEDVLDATRHLLAGFAAAALRGNAAPGEAPACDTAELQRVRATSAMYVNVTLANASGELYCAARPLGGPINVADRQYFRDAFDGRRFAISDVIVSRDSGAHVLVAAHPVLDAAGRVTAVALATVALQELGRTFQRAGAPKYVAAYLLNGRRQVLAHWPPSPSLVGTTLGTEALESRWFSEPLGIVELLDPGGLPRIAAYARLREVARDGLYVMAGVPAEEFMRAPRAALERALYVLALTLGAAVGLGVLTSHLLVVRPIHRLTAAAERFRGGDFAARSGVTHGRSEVGRLAAAFDALAQANQRVTRALKALSAGNRTLLRERSEPSLLEAMCRVAVEKGGYIAAYVCYAREDEAKSIEIMAQHGADNGFIRAVPLTWADSEYGQGTIGRAVRSGERSIIRAIAADPKTGPWKEPAKAAGIGAVISLPLRVSGAMIGTFTLASREDGLDEAEIELLDEMAADLSFGIETIRGEGRRREAEAIARRALTHDPVLDMPNRSWFIRRVIECIERGARNHEPVAVLDVHLGSLQDILDSFGHEHGNEVLRQVAERLRQLPGTDDNFARLPVDDFGIVLCAFDADAASRAARAALEVFASPMRLGEALIDVQAAVGISMFPGHGTDAETLVRRASIAAREAFRRELPHALYAGATARENPARLALAAELRSALETRQLELHFQPKVRIAGEEVAGCEALVRWRHPTLGMVPPLEFVRLAEEIGLIRMMTYKVIEMAVRQAHAWDAAGIRTPIAVNLSAKNLYDPGLLDAVEGMFTTWGIERSLVHFEITEGALVDDPAAARKTLERLSEHGARIYIDDFGTGYSSLSYLVSLPVHALKIDRSFITQMSKAVQARRLVASIISMAHNVDLRVVAEGVESLEDVAILRELGCDEAQGYHYSRPASPAQYEAWLRAHAKDVPA